MVNTTFHEVNDPESASLLAQHRQPNGVHTNLQPAQCTCGGTVVMARPFSSGNICPACGGIMVQTGTCTTCTECGTTGGCG